MSTTPPPDALPPGVGREFLAALLGVAVAFGCLLPPLIHVVTGPLGPFIGGFVAARLNPTGPRGRMIIAASVGLGMAGFVGAAAAVVANLDSRTGPPAWFPGTDMLALILVGVCVYAAALSAVGAALGSASARKLAASVESSPSP